MRTLNRWAPLLAMAVLTGIAVATLARPAPEDAEPYHARVRAAVDAVPRQVEGWIGEDVDIPEAAQRLLKPNAILSRGYRNIETGQAVTLVIVHTKDARDMLGHYPPNCYPRAGWTMESDGPRTWQVDALRYEGMEYAFSFTKPGQRQEMVVDNLLILPGGEFARDMGQVIHLASDYTRHFFGAGQVQVITPAGMTDQQRQAVFQTMIGAITPVIDALRSGPGGEDDAATE